MDRGRPVLNPNDLMRYVIRPVCESMGAWSEEAGRLLLYTAGAESVVSAEDQRLRQMNDGAALGIYQMESPTHDDTWRRHFAPRLRQYEPTFREYLPVTAYERIKRDRAPSSRHLLGNLWYATMLARGKYLLVPEPIPTGDGEQLLRYWKTYWNTEAGAGNAGLAYQKILELGLDEVEITA